MLKATGVTKSFGTTEVLKGVDLSVEKGQITCLIGPSGTGKTTLLRALGLLDLPTSGRIEIDDVAYDFPLTDGVVITPPWPRVTVVFQQLFLWPHMTLRENIMLPARNIKSTAQCKKDLDELIELFGMAHYIDKFPNESSLGQRQRVSIARALMLDPDYVLMDEITSSLDVEQISKILPHLRGLKDKNIGVFLITHLIGFARKAADQIAFMDDGTIVEQGPPEILDNPESNRLKQFMSMIEEVA